MMNLFLSHLMRKLISFLAKQSLRASVYRLPSQGLLHSSVFHKLEMLLFACEVIIAPCRLIVL